MINGMSSKVSSSILSHDEGNNNSFLMPPSLKGFPISPNGSANSSKRNSHARGVGSLEGKHIISGTPKMSA